MAIGVALVCDHVVDGADLLIAGRQHDVLVRQRMADVGRRQAVLQQFGRVEVDLDIRLGAAIGRRYGDARDRHQGRADQVGRHVVDIRWRHVVGGDLQLEHRHGGRVEHQDLGRGDPGRKLLEHGLRNGGYLRLGGRHVGPGLEEDLDDAAAVQRLALDVLDVADCRGQGALIVIHDTTRHVGGHQPVIVPDHRHDRDLNRRKDVGRGLEHRHRAEQQDQDRVQRKYRAASERRQR